MDLLGETRKTIREAKLRIKDIIFIGSRGGKYSCTWAEFKKLADTATHYIAIDLQIGFKDGSIIYWTMYGWIYSRPFQMSKRIGKKIVSLHDNYGYFFIDKRNK